jgi:hypothetical protein
MADPNTIVMCVFGGILGLIVTAVPYRSISGTPYDLRQELKFGIVLVAIAWTLIVTATTVETALTFRWKPFFATMLAVGVVANLLADAVLGGSLAARWAGSLRALYRDESYRHVPYEPSHGPFLEIFDPSTPLSIANALVCAHLSRFAYRSAQEIEKAATAWPAKARFVEEKNHAGLVVAVPGALIVAFRGTDQALDWLTNVAFWQRGPWGPEWGRVHAGFLAAVDALWPKLIAAIAELDGGPRPIWFTGHSLGGAMALLAAVKLLNEGPGAAIGGICTFGQPMVGNDRFAARLDQQLAGRFVRFETAKDDIARQPPRGTHCGALRYFDRNGGLRENPGRLERFWDSLRRDPLGPAGDHPMREYLRLMDQFRR